MKLQLPIINREIAIKIGIRKLRKNHVEGYSNATEDNRYIVFLDYDNLPLDRIIREAQRLQTDFNLGTFYIFQSSKDSFHAVCLDKLHYAHLLTVMRNATIDQNYIDVPRRWGQKIWTLRLTPKDKIGVCHVMTVPGSTIREQSSAHTTILNNLFNLHIKLEQPDQKEKIQLARYPI